MADGSITISTELDNKKLEQQLQKMKREIAKLEESTSDQEGKKSPLITQAGELEQRMKVARAEVQQYGDAWAAGVAGADKEQSAAVQRASQLEEQHAKVVAQIDKIDAKLAPAYEKLDAMKTSAGGLEQQLAKVSGSSAKMGPALRHASSSLDRFKMRLREVVRSALVFTLITQALAKFRDWMGKVIRANGEASSAVAKLKGALLTLAQPLVNILIPAFTMLVNVMTRVVSTLAQLFAMLTGTTISNTKDTAKALDEETKSLEGAGAAADKAGKSFAGFDEINQLSGSSAHGGGNSAVAPDFDFEADLTDGQLKNILGLVEAIGTAFLAWRIGKSLGLNLAQTLGLAVAIYTTIQFVKSVFDAWTNGVNMKNMIGMLASAAGVAIGLGIALGPVAAGISLVVTGLTMLTTGFHDAMEHGWDLENLLLSVAGIMTTGIGISLITGTFIPALIAGIAAVLLAITTTFGDGEKLVEDAKLVLRGFLDFFTGIFTGDIGLALNGVGEIFTGLKGIVTNVLDSLKNMLMSALDWIDEKTGGSIHHTIAFLKDIIGGGIDWMKESFEKFANSFEEIFKGIILFLSGVFSGNWDKAWEGLTKIFKGFVNLLISMVESFVNFFVNGINAVIGALNRISVDIPDWVPEFGGKSYGISIPLVPKLALPRLAQGAVIPPNREFMAVLGDQKHGTNIEAPLETIKQAVSDVVSSGGGKQEITIRFDGNMAQLVRLMKPYIDAEEKRRGVSFVTGGGY